MRPCIIGIDDTDGADSIGTGALARELMLKLERELPARSRGITRHQLLVHPDIPYTSHNSAACLELESDAPAGAVVRLCREFILYLRHREADPGLCVVASGAAPEGWWSFGRRAQREVVAKEEALALARRSEAWLEELGGTGLGVVGALSACGLRMRGDDGRFISLPGIRDFEGVVAADEIMRLTPIERIVDAGGEDLPVDAPIQTQGWVRPDLRGGRITLRVVRAESGRAWLVDRDKKLDKH